MSQQKKLTVIVMRYRKKYMNFIEFKHKENHRTHGRCTCVPEARCAFQLHFSLSYTALRALYFMSHFFFFFFFANLTILSRLFVFCISFSIR